jgi:DNA-binding Xre family transcriptional regulator
MIVFDNLWKTMKQRGITKYALIEKYSFSKTTLKRLKNNQNIETKTLDTLCKILNCDLHDIATYKKED